jgi:Fe-S cluster assembly protein SufD
MARSPGSRADGTQRAGPDPDRPAHRRGEHEDLVEPVLGSLTTSDPEGTGGQEDRTITVNDAAWTAGVFLYVPPELELSAPIGVHVHVTQPGAHLPRVLAVAGHHAKAMLYLEHTSVPGVDALVDEVIEVIARDSAEVHVASLQTWSNEIEHLSLQKVQAHRDATVGQLSITIGGRTVRLRPETDLVGPGASTRPLGIYFADEGQWFDLQPYVRHIAPRASSDVLFKGALQGRSRTVFRGNVYVAKDAVGTDTDENNKSLILTEGARADSTPFSRSTARTSPRPTVRQRVRSTHATCSISNRVASRATRRCA